MSNQGVTEAAGGVSRSGRVRKKSTKLMESLEIAKNAKLERPMLKFSPDKRPGISSPEMLTIKTECDLDGEFAIEEMEESVETVSSERLPLSAEGLPLAVPASGYYTYQGQFSNVLPKPEPKFVQKKIKKEPIEHPMSPISDNELKQSDFLDVNVMKREEFSPVSELTISVQEETPIKKKKSAKFKDKSWDADWEKLKKKKKKKKEKEKQLKANKSNETKGDQSGSIMHPDNDDSNSGSLSLVIAEPVIPLPPKKRKSGSDSKKSSGDSKKKSGEKKTKKPKANKASNDGLILNPTPDPNLTVKLEQLAQGGAIEDPDVVPAAEEKVVGSQYLTEKKKTKRRKEKFVVGTDGVVIPAKKRRPRPITAYMLWCKENRPKIVAEDPSRAKDFAAISRRMGELWQTLSDKEKMMYRRRAKKIGRRGSMISTGKKGSTKQIQSGKAQSLKVATSASEHASSSKLNSPVDLVPIYKVTGTEPIDVAAHLRLLGESLTIIGQRLTENEGQIAVSGSLSVLLDSTLCALGPLFCLTNQIEGIGSVPLDVQTSSLDSIAYVMPGL